MDIDKTKPEIQALPDGVYDLLFTENLETITKIVDLYREEEVEDSDIERVILNHIFPAIQAFIAGQKKSINKIGAANKILTFLQNDDSLITESKRLIGLVNDKHSGVSKISKLPVVPLSELALLTNLPNEPKIGNEIKAEIVSADSIDVVMSFVMKGGLNYLENELQDFANRGGKLRLITTTYMGNSDPSAIQRLARDFNADVRISLDTSKDRLHAKSWIFHRDTGFSTSYVGSSNLSYSALNDGNEWNVKISKRSSSELFAKVQASFESLWNRDGLLHFDPSTDQEILESAIQNAKPGSSQGFDSSIYRYIDVTPKKHQVDMLEALAKEREVFDRHWNLVVSATGTGKTMLSALDYRTFFKPGQPRPKILFVAHKKEILMQAVETFRIVLKDQSFGEYLFDGHTPKEWLHVFATIQSLSFKDIEKLAPDFFDYVVVDEFHHAEASSYRKLLDYLQPRELLALTATPERTDLVNVQDNYFDGHISAELRLWDAIAENLLVPFRYFGIADGTDLSQIKWAKGNYARSDLENLFTANDARNSIIYNSIIKYIDSAVNMRALAFCVSKAHAQSMADFLNSRGIKAVDVTSSTSSIERKLAISQLARGEINVICAVDIFNEGVDIPAIDTVLFLRPSESPLIFLQQLGRGLRTSDNKHFLTVLDFVGLHRTEYKFVKKLQALTSQGKMSIQQNIENDFPYLPSGCQIVFDKKSKEIVLNNLKSQIKSKFNNMVEELKACGDVSLREFLEISGFEISDVYANSKSWSLLRHAAGFIKADFSKVEEEISRRLSSFYYAADPVRNQHYRNLLIGNVADFQVQTVAQRVLTSMYFWNLFPTGGLGSNNSFATYAEGIHFIEQHPFLSIELGHILEIARESCALVPKSLSGKLEALPLFTHASYSRPELLAAFGYAQLFGQEIGSTKIIKTRGASAHVTGVHFAEHLNSDVFFVTLDKSGNNFSQKTAYMDFAISKWLFHWESRNDTGPETTVGMRYLNHNLNNHNLILAVRAKRRNELGTSPFQLLGSCDVEHSEGAFPMKMTLRMHRTIPNEVLEASPVYEAI